SFTTTFTYDALDRRITETDNVGNQLQRFYDSRDNLVQENDALGRKTRYFYDGIGRRIQTRRDMNGNGVFTDGVDIALLQAWDDTSRLVSETDDNGCITRYAYDSLDRKIVTQHPDGTLEQVGTGATWVLGQTQPNLTAFVSGYDAH